VIKEVRDKLKPSLEHVSLHYIKFDAMIVACARRHQAEAIITADIGQRALAAKVGLAAHGPKHYLVPHPPQESIAFPRDVMEAKPPRGKLTD